jgi:hypothetical protein
MVLSLSMAATTKEKNKRNFQALLAANFKINAHGFNDA